KKLSDVIDDHKGSNVTITYDWDGVLGTAHSQIFVPCGAPGNEASFYDFVVWLAATRGGVFTFDASTSAYKLAAAKDASGTATSLIFGEVGSIELHFPEPCRAAANVLNSYVTNAQTTAGTPANADAATGIRRDVLMRSTVAADVTALAAIEGAKVVS